MAWLQHVGKHFPLSLLTPYLLSSQWQFLHQCGVHIGLYTLSSRQGLHIGYHIVKGVSERCIVRLLLTIRLKMSVNCSMFVRNSFLPFLSNTESLRLSFIQSISVSVIFLLMSSASNQGYLSSEVNLFVSSTGNSVHVVICGISVGWMVFSHAKGVGQVSFCHGGTDLLENVLSYLFVLGS